MPDYIDIDANLRCAMQFFGRASGSGEITELDGSLGVFSGLDYGVFNIGLLTRSVREGEIESRLSDLGKFFRRRTLRWSAWICEDQLDPAVRKREKQIFASYGMRPISQPPGMLAKELTLPIAVLPKLDIRPVVDAATRSAFTELTSIAFEIPYTVAHAVYTREEAWRGDYQGFVGFAEGRPVSIIALVAAAGVIGVYSLATLHGFRNRGYAETMLRTTVDQISHRTGLTRVILQSTEAGYALYKRMGFRDVTRFTVYLTK